MYLNARRTYQIPWLRVIESPLNSYVQNRYGVISYDPVLNKFCLVKLKYSSAFRRFARGQFYLGEIDDLAKQLTASECRYINWLLSTDANNAVKAYTSLLSEMYDINCGIPGRVERFKDLHTITRYINVTDREDYLVFPSGSKDPSETDESSAIREMIEETGISKIYGISENSILYSYTSWDNINYTVNYWIGIVEAPKFSPKNKEVDGTVWVDEIPEEYDAASILEILKNLLKRINPKHQLITPTKRRIKVSPPTMSTSTNTSNNAKNDDAIKYTEFIPTSIKIGNSIPKEITDKTTNTKIKYAAPPISYLNGNRMKPMIIEAPEVQCSGLIPAEWKDPTGKVISKGEYEMFVKAAQVPGAPQSSIQYVNSLMVSQYKLTNRYDSHNPEHMKYIQSQYDLSAAIIGKIAKQHSNLFPVSMGGPPQIGVVMDEAQQAKQLAQGVTGIFKYPVFPNTDNPSILLEVCKFYTTGGGVPSFTGLDGRSWSFKELEGKVVTWIPAIHIKDVYENQSMVKPRKTMASAVIISATRAGYADLQNETIKALAADEEKMAAYARSLAELGVANTSAPQQSNSFGVQTLSQPSNNFNPNSQPNTVGSLQPVTSFIASTDQSIVTPNMPMQQPVATQHTNPLGTNNQYQQQYMVNTVVDPNQYTTSGQQYVAPPGPFVQPYQQPTTFSVGDAVNQQ